jgi:hypothetical protein
MLSVRRLTTLATRYKWYVAAFVVVAAASWMYRRRREKARKERFFPALIPLAGLGITAGMAALKLTGKEKDVTNKIMGGGGSKTTYQPTYVGRQWDGSDWSCPYGTIETGMDNSKACVNGGFHPPMWRWNGKEWSHSCMNGTVPTTEGDWEKKCEAGWTQRVFGDGVWKCPEGTQDTGKNFDNTSWHDAHKQCKRGRAYTTRIQVGGKWVCPDFSKDTGRSWGQANEWDQCKWMP